MLELFNAEVTLERFPGKGGWTYAPVGQLPFKVKTHFGNLKVCGRLDEVELAEAHLMPMGQGRRFLPVNAELRKKLGKQAGDVVHLRLFAVEEPEELAVSMADFVECLAEVPKALAAFQRLAVEEQQAWLAWVTQAELEDQKVARIEQAIAQLSGEVLTFTPPPVGPGVR
ncbi:YdeI/OmpD-associated family protein [Hymenobacter arizonensis]|uniref:Bacteriocin-protection, YdeI or OmpD-Associated n=1 Tax=Hymenobacter arizonensis TaxID=1227077 RepID=A0A1I5XU02_HYMAR|nr:YdeI/OmpD-associated family protein [Hymenobacter arizonensis]SFQ35408.1 Bacteriocin-protection, YdeI or OmpD-Associated [Hymenobacter arizonensis]